MTRSPNPKRNADIRFSCAVVTLLNQQRTAVIAQFNTVASGQSRGRGNQIRIQGSRVSPIRVFRVAFVINPSI
ncbi:MAG: hypothetical protein AAFP90_22265, partial [Planctomycetota bacterium]